MCFYETAGRRSKYHCGVCLRRFRVVGDSARARVAHKRSQIATRERHVRTNGRPAKAGVLGNSFHSAVRSHSHAYTCETHRDDSFIEILLATPRCYN